MSNLLFVSYSRADWHYVELIVAEIRRRGVSTWVDIEDILPGDHWKQAVSDAIENSSALMFCISPLCLESGRTLTELRKAIERDKTVIPVMVERVDYCQLPKELSERQVIEVWQDPPAAGAVRASVRIAQRLKPGLVFEEDETTQSTVANLILIVGDADPDPVRRWLDEHAVKRTERIVARKVRAIEDLALVERWIPSAIAVHIVVGENVSSEVCAFFFGYVHAVAGSASMCVFTTQLHEFAEAIVAPLHVRCRRMDEFSLPNADGVDASSRGTEGADG